MRCESNRFLLVDLKNPRCGDVREITYVSFGQDLSAEGKHQQRRRGPRVNSRVPVAIEWSLSPGTAMREKAHTRIVGHYGCLLVIPQELQVEQRIRLTNLANNETSDAVIVWKGNQRVEGWELGIELVNPDMGFWGLEI